ncbi:hypothetical protein CXB51_035356 [Gossypium anomalum]|uniref:Reverse transcriptase zinc-binding domain-containing protein n=1 Tax=Gossypium anomalum TaxID=47600 RepID=A0A8J6CLR7_9ROSI|nr:hypothetical protein CXB51_035356 [Gossypium anomalum]
MLGDQICNIPITRTGVYTLKSAYSWSLLKKIGFGPHRIFWKLIWKLNMLPKIKVFSWRLGHDHLPSYDNIARIRQNFSNTCPRCKNSAETIIHVMKDCPVSREILTLGGLNNRLMEGIYDRYISWLEDVIRVLDAKATADFFTLLWNIWNHKKKIWSSMERGMCWERFRKRRKPSAKTSEFTLWSPYITLTLANKNWMNHRSAT